jgi:hypothetical protein
LANGGDLRVVIVLFDWRIGATAMQKVLEYEQHAAACRRKAAETKNVELKKQLEDG